MRKMTMLVAGGVGYVLGARAGRERYDQITTMVSRFMGNPTVQATAKQAADKAKEAAPVVKDKVGDVADTVTQKMSSQDDTSSLNQSAYPTTS